MGTSWRSIARATGSFPTSPEVPRLCCVGSGDPGTAATNMRAEAFPGEDPNTLAAPDDITERFVELAEVSCGESGGKVFV